MKILPRITGNLKEEFILGVNAELMACKKTIQPHFL